MSLTINSDFIIFGKNPIRGFTTNYFYSWEDENPEHSAKLYINYSIGDVDIDGEEFAQELFEVVRHQYFQDFTRNPHERFEEMLNEVNKLALEWREKHQIKFFTDLDIVIGIVQDNNLYITQCGHAEAYLIRKRHLTMISEGLSDSDKDRDTLFVNVASGALEDYDTLIFSTARLLRYVPKNEVVKMFMRDSSLASSFSELKDSIEMELDHHINILALNVLKSNSKLENDSSEDVEKLESKTKQLTTLVANLKNKLGRKQNIKGYIAKDEHLHVNTRKKPSKSLINIKDLTDFSTFGKDKILVSLVVVILILIMGLMVLRTKNVNKKRLSDLGNMLEQVQVDLNEAETRGTFDKEGASELINQAEEKVKLVLKAGEFRNKALQYREDIKEQRDRLDNIIRVEDPIVLADLSEKRDGVNAIGLIPFGDSLYAYEYNALYESMLDKLQDPLTIDENEEVIDGTYFDDRKSLLLLTKSHKIIEFKDNFVQFMDTQDPAWKSGDKVEVYGERMYLLDSEDSTIWRYRRGRVGYTGAEEYLTGGDIVNAIDIAIDGAVYLLSKTGEITKYYAGEIDEEFQVLRAPMTPLSAPTKMYTEFEFNQVFILEPSENRVLSYTKDIKTGNFVYSHQYSFDPALGTLKDIYVDKDSNVLYVLTESKILKIDT